MVSETSPRDTQKLNSQPPPHPFPPLFTNTGTCDSKSATCPGDSKSTTCPHSMMLLVVVVDADPSVASVALAWLWLRH